MTEVKIIKDHTILIETVYSMLERDKAKFESFPTGESSILKKFSYGKDCSAGEYVVLGEDTAIELGPPGTLSVSRLFWTYTKNIVQNRAYIIGDPLYAAGKEKLSFLQIVIAELDEEDAPDHGDLNRIKNLANRIPGYMTRTIPDKIWIRIHRKLVKKGFSLRALAEALFHSYTSGPYRIKNAGVILIAGDEASIREFAPLCDAAGAISAENRKQRWIEDGVLTCEDLDCSSCTEKKDCDTIKELLINRRSNKNG